MFILADPPATAQIEDVLDLVPEFGTDQLRMPSGVFRSVNIRRPRCSGGSCSICWHFETETGLAGRFLD